MENLNNTKNQHYISQSEMRLNAKPGESRNKIYSFTVTNKQNFEIHLENDKGTNIENCLCDFDIFSINVLDKKYRKNMEQLFQKYESHIEEHTNSLLTTINAGGKIPFADIKNIFALKFFNLLRNPNCINFTIDTFKYIEKYMDEMFDMPKIRETIASGNRPHSNSLCKKYGFSQEDYDLWLTSLMVLLNDFEGKPVFDIIIDGFFSDPLIYKFCLVYTYDEQQVLISDNGFVKPDISDMSETTWSLMFNLKSNAFFIINFTENPLQIKKLKAENTLPPTIKNIPATQLATIVAGAKQYAKLIKNDLKILSIYNKTTVSQASLRVYCSTKTPYAITVR